MHPRLQLALSLLAGALTPLAIAPFSYWWLGIITLALLAWNLQQLSSKKQLLAHAFLFGLGYFGTGVSWVFISIYEFGSSSFALAILLTSVFVIFIALLFALPFYGLGYFKNNDWRLLLGFPLFWTLSEWLRGWLFTGFPWLYIGYSHIDISLIGWAPVGGVLFISLLSAFSSSVLCFILLKNKNIHRKILAAIAVIMFWTEGSALRSFEWTQAAGDTISVGIVQPNIPQELKWAPEFREPSKTILTSLSDDLWNNNWIIWPEAAIPDIYFRSKEFIDQIDAQAKDSHTSVITGVLYDDHAQQKYFNALIGLGDAEGFYFKQRLVPFGEYVPLESWLRGLIAFFNLPTSIIASGNTNQTLIHAGNITIASAICYEIVYPSLVAQLSKNANVILTVSNDAWFGDSIGPLQHFHMARMRAIETGRYVIRGTNNGVSAIITPKGQVQIQSEQFIRTSITGTITPMQGHTPYLLWRDYFVLTILLLLGAILFYTARTTQHPQPDQNP